MPDGAVGGFQFCQTFILDGSVGMESWNNVVQCISGNFQHDRLLPHLTFYW